MIELCCLVLICTVHLTVCSYHVKYAFQSESTLYSCLNVKELLARSTCVIRSLIDGNWTGTRNHLVHIRSLNHLRQLVKRLPSKHINVESTLKQR